METKKMIIALIVLLVIVFSIIFIVAKSNSKSKNTNKTGYEEVYIKKETDDKNAKKIESKYTANVINSYYNSLDEEGRKNIDDKIDKVIELINKKNIDELYSMLAPMYKKAKFYTKDMLYDYILRELPEEDYSSSGYRLLDNNVMYFNLINNKNEFVKEIRISFYNNENAVIYLDPIFSIYKHKFYKREENYSIGANYLFSYGDKVSFIFNINNFTDSTMKFDFAGTYLNSTRGYVNNYSDMIVGDNTQVSVAANSANQIELFFEPLNGSIDGIELIYTLDNKEYEVFCPIIDETDDDIFD